MNCRSCLNTLFRARKGLKHITLSTSKINNYLLTNTVVMFFIILNWPIRRIVLSEMHQLNLFSTNETRVSVVAMISLSFVVQITPGALFTVKHEAAESIPLTAARYKRILSLL